jgi:hypothetical protein
MSIAPESLAQGRFKPLAKVDEKVARLSRDLAEARQSVTNLETKQAIAARRDKQAYAAALSEGKGRPSKREEPKVTAELEDMGLRAEALRLAVDSALDERAKLLKANHPLWRRQTQRELERASSRYERAISELESARDGLSDEAALVGWLDGHPGVEAASDQLGGRVGDAEGRAPLSFTAVVAELRRDGAAIAAHPATRHERHPHLASEHVKVGAILEGWRGE